MGLVLVVRFAAVHRLRCVCYGLLPDGIVFFRTFDAVCTGCGGRGAPFGAAFDDLRVFGWQFSFAAQFSFEARTVVLAALSLILDASGVVVCYPLHVAFSGFILALRWRRRLCDECR